MLKVHKREIFLIFDWATIGGDRIVPRILSIAEGRFFSELGKNKFFFNSQVPSYYLLKIDFPKFNPLTATGIVFYRKILKTAKFI